MGIHFKMMQFLGRTIRIRSYSNYTKIRDLSEKQVGSPIEIKVRVKRKQKTNKNCLFK